MSLAIVRGGGDLATGVIYRLWRTGFTVLVLETNLPTVIRRTVSVAQAVFDGVHKVEGMTSRLIASVDELPDNGDVGILTDPEADTLKHLKPDILVDAIMAKRNCGTQKSMAPHVVALGPGFTAPEDVHAVIETLRGHTLGRVITKGSAISDTGEPGEIGGATFDRLVRSPGEGLFLQTVSIGDRVKEGDTLGTVCGKAVIAKTGGVVRGLIHPTVPVKLNMKIGDIDPRAELENCFSISDKALAIGGGVLEFAFSRKVKE